MADIIVEIPAEVFNFIINFWTDKIIDKFRLKK